MTKTKALPTIKDIEDQATKLLISSGIPKEEVKKGYLNGTYKKIYYDDDIDKVLSAHEKHAKEEHKKAGKGIELTMFWQGYLKAIQSLRGTK